ncbi:DUF418 domain-containing protein [Chloroflexi bacterium TSY]|nr:DUF418 domain-containing protein [Chloroflexi bacterium TSY]
MISPVLREKTVSYRFLSIYQKCKPNFEPPRYQYNYWASILVSLGYIGMVMRIVQQEWLPRLQNTLAAVGRTALTNYLMQTILATAIFYGHGLGLFGTIERTGQLLVVFAIWVVQLFISPLWLQYFRYGPFEWMWRSLTYWRLQPLWVQPKSPPLAPTSGQQVFEQ